MIKRRGAEQRAELTSRVTGHRTGQKQRISALQRPTMAANMQYMIRQNAQKMQDTMSDLYDW